MSRYTRIEFGNDVFEKMIDKVYINPNERVRLRIELKNYTSIELLNIIDRLLNEVKK